jgi:hypothetical protein
MPRLRELDVRASLLGVRRLFGAPLIDLRLLTICSPPELALDVVAENKSLARLERLHIDAASGSFGPREPVPFVYVSDQLRAFLAATHFTSLSALTLRVHDLGDEGCALIARSGLLRQLRRLDLRYCGISDDGAEALARSPDLKNLEWLDVGGNQMTPMGAARLQEAAPEAEVKWDSTWGDYPFFDGGGDAIV